MSAETQIPEVGDSVIYICDKYGWGWFENGSKLKLISLDDGASGMNYLLVGLLNNRRTKLWVTREEFYIVP